MAESKQKERGEIGGEAIPTVAEIDERKKKLQKALEMLGEVANRIGSVNEDRTELPGGKLYNKDARPEFKIRADILDEEDVIRKKLAIIDSLVS